MAWLVIPQQLVQLQLHSDLQIIRQDPLCQLSAFKLSKAWRKQHIRDTLQQTIFIQLKPSPVIILTITNNKLNFL